MFMICTPKVRHFWRCIFFMGKTGRENRRYSTEFKMCVIMDMREHHLSYRETVRKYWEEAKGKEPNYIHRVQRWERIFLEEGAEGLMKERRGKSYGSKKGRPPKLDKKAEEDLNINFLLYLFNLSSLIFKIFSPIFLNLLLLS